MRVRMLSPRTQELQGIVQKLRIGQELEVSRGLALKWEQNGGCVILDRKMPPSARPIMGNAEMECSRPSTLTLAMRAWWYGNVGGHFDWHGRLFPRAAVHLHGGPNPELNSCLICQADEWASRIGQRQTWMPDHGCAITDPARTLISRQGSPDWPHFQVNYWYAAHAGDEAGAPRCAMVEPIKGNAFIFGHHCDQSVHVWMRQMAQVCHYDVLCGGGVSDFKRYDFALVVNSGSDVEEAMPLPPAGFPTIMYGHDLWKRRQERQRYLDQVKLAVLWTPFPSSWKAHFHIPEETKIVFRPVPASSYFTSPNLDDGMKELDLLVVGAMGAPIYGPRIELDAQLEDFAANFRVRFSHHGGSRRARWEGKVNEDKMPYMNAWSAYLGKARYVIFGPIAEEPQPVFYKYYECLGSGAVPIMPDAPDLALLGVRAWEHFIPLSHVWGSKARLLEVLRAYEEHRHIAENAVLWHTQNADRLLFDNIDEVVEAVTGARFPRRLRE